jgi:hypothetical protein
MEKGDMKMDIKTLKNRIASIETQIEKKKKSIERKTASLVKEDCKTLKDMIREEIGWAEKDLQKMLHKRNDYYRALAKEQKREEKLEAMIPECLRDFRSQLVQKWNDFDMKKRDAILKDQAENNDWLKRWDWDDLYWAKDADWENINEVNLKAATMVIEDLICRTTKKCGEITSWSGLRVTYGNRGFGVLNGFVEGTSGKAIIESIVAGGYNIQRLHVRVLVK